MQPGGGPDTSGMNAFDGATRALVERLSAGRTGGVQGAANQMTLDALTGEWRNVREISERAHLSRERTLAALQRLTADGLVECTTRGVYAWWRRAP